MSFMSSLTAGTARITRFSLGAALGLGLLWSAVPDMAAAQDHTQHTDHAAAQVEVSRPALWVVRDADSTIYMFGTIHLMRPGHDWMGPQITEAFNAAQTLWLEIEDPTDQAAAAPLIMQHGLSPAQPLSSRLTPEEFAELDRPRQRRRR